MGLPPRTEVAPFDEPYAGLDAVVRRSCPRVRVLATSREPLRIGGEHVYRLASLSLPAVDATSLEDLEHSDAVRLFVERARAHDSTFSLKDPVAGLVGSICRTLDGIPLALELAAARVPGMSLANLNERLDPALPAPYGRFPHGASSAAHPAGHLRLVF